jgi:ADP-heptose:LPS heptosyltransferase
MFKIQKGTIGEPYLVNLEDPFAPENLIPRMNQDFLDATNIKNPKAREEALKSFSSLKAAAKKYDVCILDSKNNQTKWDLFLDKNFKDKSEVRNLSKSSHDINCAISMVSLSAGVIGVDSALTHISAALKKPTVAIYGPFKSDLISRYYKNYTSINPPEGWNECGIYACGLTPKESHKCPYVSQGNIPQCMESNSAEKIVEELFKLIG